MSTEIISKTDKYRIMRTEQIDSIFLMLHLVTSYHQNLIGIFPPELVLAICWEESYFQNISQYGGGPAVGYGQLEQGGRIKAQQHESNNYNSFGQGRFTAQNILQDRRTSIEGVSHCLAGLYSHPKLQHTRDGALKAYAGVFHRAENAPIPGQWSRSADALRACVATPSPSMSQVEDALRLARHFDTSGPVYAHIHARLWPLVDMIGKIVATVQQYSAGQQVAYVQDALNRVPMNAAWSSGAIQPLKVDGLFGPKTAARVKLFQSCNGLVADAIVGPKTRAALLARAESAA